MEGDQVGDDGSAKKAPTLKKTSGLFEFSNQEAIKKKVREKQMKPNQYDVHTKYHKTGFFAWLAKHKWFENFTLFVIVSNALWISVDTDGNTADTLLDAKTHFIIADCLFFGYFTIELFVRFMAFERKQDCCKDGWFVFDSALVFLYAFDPFSIALVAAIKGGGGLDLPTALLRLLRLARLSRLVRMLRSLPELMIMIKGMVTASASVAYTLFLLMMITYVFAIALRNRVPVGSGIEETYFSSVLEAMHNLIIFGTFLDNLADFIWDIKAESESCLILTWLYIALASLTVMNMLIGVLCEVISAVASEEKESLMVDKVQSLFGRILSEIDTNQDGTISWNELEQIPNYPEALAALESVGVDAESMIDIAEEFFHDDNGEQVCVTFREFMDMVLDLRGGQQATVKDVMRMGKGFSKKILKVNARMDSIEGKLDKILTHISSSPSVH